MPQLQIGSLKDPQLQFRVLLGFLLVANLVAAGFAFHLFDESPEQLAHQVTATHRQVLEETVKLNRTQMLAGKVQKGREQGTRFMADYMTSRRSTYSTIISELNQTAKDAGMKAKDAVTGLDAVQGTDSLDILTITYSFEGSYENLVKFINLLDKSKRFLIIESLAATPQQSGALQVTVKLNTFVKDDSNSL